MSGRVLFCIGCNTYEDNDVFSELMSAETDATNVFEQLRDSESGNYDAERSQLFLSPTLDDVRDGLRHLSLDGESISTLTLFFAGHGDVRNGNLYLCTRDTRGDALSMSAFSLSDLFRMVGDQQIPHTNIVLDACYSGAMLNDLSALLRTDIIGARDTPSVTILAMSASNEFATEDQNGGLGTQALLACLRGEIEINKTKPILNLLEIGQEVSNAFNEGAAQKPVFWGLNLTGSSDFCVNPCFETGADTPAGTSVFLSEGINIPISENQTNSLWRTYLDLAEKWDARAFYDQLTDVLEKLQGHSHEQAVFAEQIALSFSTEAQNNVDASVAFEVYAICALALMAFSDSENELDNVCEGLMQRCLELSIKSIEELTKRTEEDIYSYLGRGGGGFDFYYLPIKVSKILGWAAFNVLVSQQNDSLDTRKNTLKRLVKFTVDEYPMCLKIMNDSQASALALLGSALRAMGSETELEDILSYYLHSLAAEKGLMAPVHLPPTKIFDFLVDRLQGTLELASDLVARPSELIAVCFRLASIVNMRDVVDDFMLDLDHLSINAYLPCDYKTFGADTLRGGTNVTMRIGHDVFRVEDFENHWPEKSVPLPTTEAQFSASLAASLIFPDRVAWHIVTYE